MELITWKEIEKESIIKPTFYIEPFVVKEGITLLWAKFSRGKSPLTWEMARAIGSGTHFFGFPAQQGRVLYIDVDSPPMVAKSRVKKLSPAENVWFMFSKPFSIPEVSPEEREALAEADREVRPDVVFLNTLRKLHNLEDKDSKTPKLVYSFFQHLFPRAALVFVHHERKTSTDPRASQIEGEDFSGSQHWIDDAQVGLQIQKWTDREGRSNLRLYHRKSQVSTLMKPLPLKLDADGSHMKSPLFEDQLLVYEMLNEGSLGHGQVFDRELASRLKCSESTVRRKRLHVEEGRFPGTAWMEKEPFEEEGE